MAVPAHCSLPSQTSSKVQALPSSHGVLAGWKASGGQYTLVPVQVLGAAPSSDAARQTVAALAGGGMHRPLPAHSSALTTLPSSAHAVPLAAGVPVVARGAVRLRGAGADAALTGVVARAGTLVVARGAVEQRSVADAGAVLAGVSGGAGVAVVAGRAVRLGGVVRAVHARPRAGLGRVTDVGRAVADCARVGGRVNAPAAPVARIRAARVAVVRARGAARGRRARARPGLTAVGRR